MSFQRWMCHFRVECVILEVDVSFQSECVISEVEVSFQS